MTLLKNKGNGVQVAMSAEEETTHLAHLEALKVEKQTAVDAAAQKETDKTNGNQKLLDLGLTQAEVDALTGQ